MDEVKMMSEQKTEGEEQMEDIGNKGLDNDEIIELIFRRIKEVKEEVQKNRAIIELTQMILLEVKTELKNIKGGD